MRNNNYKMNKYGGINDLPNCDSRIYNLWYQILRRCYDNEQQIRAKGRCYRGCTVSDDWKLLSNFANDIKYLKGYSDWINSRDYCIDKDIKARGNKIYGKEFCQFVSKFDNSRYVTILHPHNTEAMQRANLTRYKLTKNGKSAVFESEKEACKYLGVCQCSVSSCYRRNVKCKGYKIERIDMDEEGK